MFPVTKIFMGDGQGYRDIVKFSDEYNGTIIYSADSDAIGMEISLLRPLHKSNEWVDYNESPMKPSEYFTNELLASFRENGIFKQDESVRGDGGSTSYYKLPDNATELGDLIWHKNMNHSIGEAFCALYRLEDNGERKRNLKKVQYYIEQELSRC